MLQETSAGNVIGCIILAEVFSQNSFSTTKVIFCHQIGHVRKMKVIILKRFLLYFCVCVVEVSNLGESVLSTMWVLGMEFRLSGLEAITFTYWAISPVLTVIVS